MSSGKEKYKRSRSRSRKVTHEKKVENFWKNYKMKKYKTNGLYEEIIDEDAYSNPFIIKREELKNRRFFPAGEYLIGDWPSVLTEDQIERVEKYEVQGYYSSDGKEHGWKYYTENEDLKPDERDYYKDYPCVSPQKVDGVEFVSLCEYDPIKEGYIASPIKGKFEAYLPFADYVIVAPIQLVKPFEIALRYDAYKIKFTEPFTIIIDTNPDYYEDDGGIYEDYEIYSHRYMFANKKGKVLLTLDIWEKWID